MDEINDTNKSDAFILRFPEEWRPMMREHVAVVRTLMKGTVGEPKYEIVMHTFGHAYMLETLLNGELVAINEVPPRIHSDGFYDYIGCNGTRKHDLPVTNDLARLRYYESDLRHRYLGPVMEGVGGIQQWFVKDAMRRDKYFALCSYMFDTAFASHEKHFLRAK